MADSSPNPDEPPDRPILEVIRDGMERFGGWLVEHEQEIENFMANMQFFADHSERLESTFEKWSSRPYGYEYLFDAFGFYDTVGLLLELEQGGEEVIEALLARAFADRELVNDLCSALEGAGRLEDARKRQLQQGLMYVADGDHELAAPLLSDAVEHLFWNFASGRGVVEQDAKNRQRFTGQTGRVGDEATSVDAVFGYLGLEQSFEEFLRRHVYGKEGNPYRHGTASGGWRRHSLFLAVALCGWLKLVDDQPTDRWLAAAVERAREANEAG